jgi:hypothetical protein
MFQFFHSTHKNTVFPLLQSCSFVPILLPPNSTLSFFTRESAGISSHPFKQITHLSRLCFEGPVTIIVGVSQICLHSIHPHTHFPVYRKTYFVWTSKYFRKYCHKKIKSVVIFIITLLLLLLLLLLLQSPHGARASTAISQMRPNI